MVIDLDFADNTLAIPVYLLTLHFAFDLAGLVIEYTLVDLLAFDFGGIGPELRPGDLPGTPLWHLVSVYLLVILSDR